MYLDLSFWEPPNWKKEGSISPVFLASVVGVASIIAGLLYAMTLLNEASMLEDMVAKKEAAVKEKSKVYDPLKKQQDLASFVSKSIIKPLEWKVSNRKVWSSRLYKIFKEIPESVVLEGIVLKGEYKRPTKKSKKKKIDKGRLHFPLQYELTISGYGTGKDPDGVIRKLSKRLKSKEVFGDETVRVSLQGAISSKLVEDKNVRVFTLVCRFKEI